MPTQGELTLVGAVLVPVVGALVWHMRTTTTELMQVIRENTAALTELRAALRGRVICPYQPAEDK
jgi:hypothetical protein